MKHRLALTSLTVAMLALGSGSTALAASTAEVPPGPRSAPGAGWAGPPSWQRGPGSGPHRRGWGLGPRWGNFGNPATRAGAPGATTNPLGRGPGPRWSNDARGPQRGPALDLPHRRGWQGGPRMGPRWRAPAASPGTVYPGRGPGWR